MKAYKRITGFIFIFMIFSTGNIINDINKIGLYNTATGQEQEVKKEGIVDNITDNQGDDVKNNVYIVMAVIIIIWFGLALYIFRIDRKIIRLERELE